MADATAMTVDFLRARLLSERSVSRAAKERAEELARRVAELEEQVRAVTAQRRQAERAAAEVLAILDAHGFGAHLSDTPDDSGSDNNGGDEEDDGDDAKSRGDTVHATGEEQEPSPAAARGAEAEDALSATAHQPGGLSWKGRSVSPRKARQLRQKHRRSFFRLVSSSDSSPKYRMGQSCRKNKRRMEPRSAASEEDGGDAVAAAGSHNGQQDGSGCTDDGHADVDGEVGGDERSSGDGGGGDGGQYVIRYEKDGEMERVLERQAELIGQYEEEEEAQREWEKQYNENRNATKGDGEVWNKPCQTNVEAKSSDKKLHSATNPSAECLPSPNGSSESRLSASHENGGAQRREANEEPDHGRAQAASVSVQESSSNSTITRQKQELGDESDGDSGSNTCARSPVHNFIKAPSHRSNSSDTLNSKVSDWSSSHFHDHTDSSSNIDIESVLQALQQARISLRVKLGSPVPPSQVTLALPAPGDEHKEYDDLPAGDDGNSSCREEFSSSSPARQEILALPAPEDYHETADLPVDDAGISLAGKLNRSSPPREEILALPAPGDDYRKEIEDYMKIPACTPGLFRLPTDSFPADERMFPSSNAYGSGFSLGAASNLCAGLTISPAAHGEVKSAPSVSEDGSGLSTKQCHDLHSSALLSVPTPGRCSGSSGIPGLEEDLRRGKPLGDADLFMQRGIDYNITNKWML
ncbi:hypothetical protein ACP4OV_030098 [Aristida adscensionis]